MVNYFVLMYGKIIECFLTNKSGYAYETLSFGAQVQKRLLATYCDGPLILCLLSLCIVCQHVQLKKQTPQKP